MLSFIETTLFTRRIIELGAEESYRAVQNELAANSDAGAVIPGLFYTKNDFEDQPPDAKKALRQRITQIKKEFEK